MPNLKDSEAGESIALRAFAVLETVAAASDPVSLDDVTQAVSLPKPTVFRILTMLHSADLLRREPGTKRYTVGTRLTAFAADVWRNASLRSLWHRALEQAVEEIGESCNFTLLEGDQVLYLDRVETRHPLRMHLEPGVRVPLHCTASGKLFLSRMTSAEVHRLLGDEPYERYTPKTITTFDALEADLKRIRKTNVGTHDCELFDDSVAIAVPVLGPGGPDFAAIAMHAPSSRASIKGCMAFVPSMERAAAAISATVARGPTTPLKKIARSAGAATAGAGVHNGARPTARRAAR